MTEFAARIDRIETIVEEIEHHGDPALQSRVRELLQAVLELHGTALARLLEDVYDRCGQEFVDALAENDLIGSVLLLHDLHPQSRTARVVDALEKVKPYLASHGGNVEFVQLRDDGALVLRLEGSCHGCPSSQATLKYTIEEAVFAAAPDVRAIEIEQQDDQGDEPEEFIPMTEVQWQECPFPADGLSSESTITTRSRP